jgi:hypothetical protein
MENELFAKLVDSMGEALEHARGKRELRTTVLPAAPTAMNAKVANTSSFLNEEKEADG